MLWRERGSNTIDPTENQQSTLQLVVWCMVDTDNHIKPNYQKLMVCCTHKAKCQMIIKIKIYRLFKHLTCSEKEDINVLPCCFVPTWLAEERIMFLVAKTWKCLVGIWHITTQCKLDSISVEKKSVPRMCPMHHLYRKKEFHLVSMLLFTGNHTVCIFLSKEKDVLNMCYWKLSWWCARFQLCTVTFLLYCLMCKEHL